MKDIETAISPFDNGSHFLDWNNWNCCRCTKGGDDGMGVGCEISDALTLACCMKGEVSPDIAARMGYTEAHAAFHAGKEPPPYNWRCGEFDELPH